MNKWIIARVAMRRCSRLLAYAISACLLLVSTSCSKDPEKIRVAAIKETYDRLLKCVPENADEGDLKLAIASVSNEENETQVRLVGYAFNSPAEFVLPVYRLSSGRWLIGEKDRVYLVNDQCREFKLKDRKAQFGQTLPLDGVIKMSPGQAFEITLRFPRLPDQTKFGMLVYGRRNLPFLLGQQIPPKSEDK